MPTPCDTLLNAAWIITQDEDRSALRDAALAVKGGKILWIGPKAEAAVLFSPKTGLDLGEALIMPGLINSHTHAPMTLLRGFADDLPLMEWLNSYIFPVEKDLTPKLLTLGTLLACAELARTGCTAFSDMYLGEEHVYRAVDKAGLKAQVGEVLFSFPSIAYPDEDAAFSLVERQADELKNHPRISLCLAPHSVYTTSPALLERCAAFAEKRNLPLIIHLAETRQETKNCLEAHGKRPLELCRAAGLLHPLTTLDHAVDLTDAELDELAASGAAVAHNPKSNMKLASGVARVPEMLARGIPVGLGTDGAASNNSLNMFSEMNACALLHKVHALSPTAAKAQEVLDMATLGGAAALHRPELGRLKPGGPADLIALDLEAPNLQPLHNPVSSLVYASSGHEVMLTMVDGEILYLDGKFTRLDYPALLGELKGLHDWMKKRRA